MRALVTGATGFIGGHLIRSLQAAGDDVVAVARTSPRADALAAQGVRVVEGDLREQGVVRDALAGCEVVYHLATVRSGPSVDRLESRPGVLASHQGDVEATRCVVVAAVERKVDHLVYCSSAGVHGRLERVPADESHRIAPDTPHRRAKLAGEETVGEAVREHGLSAIILRPTSVYGPGDERAGRFFRWIRSGNFRFVGTGRIPYHYTYVDDIVQGLRLAGEQRGVPGTPYLLGSDVVPTLREFMDAVAEEAGVELPIHRLPLGFFQLAARLSRSFLVPLGARPAVIRNSEFFSLPRAFDVSRAKQDLGFRPSVSLNEGIRKTMEWIRATSPSS